MGVFPGEGNLITVLPSSIVGADGTTVTDRDDCAVDGMTPVKEHRCLLFLPWEIFYLKRCNNFFDMFVSVEWI